MRKLLLLAFLPLTLAPMAALAKYDGPPKSRGEEIDRVKARLARLEKMSDDEWEQRRKHNEDRRQAFLQRSMQQQQQGQAAPPPPPPPDQDD